MDCATLRYSEECLTAMPLRRRSLASAGRTGLRPILVWLAAGLLFLAPTPNCVGQIVAISDPNLEQAIREALNKPSGDLTTEDTQGLTALFAPNRGITTLDGFNTASNLVILDLNYNALSSASLGPGFPRLEHAKFRGNGMTNFTATGPLPSLDHLELSENMLTNVAFLQQTPLMTYLELDYNELASFDPGPGLDGLIWLNLAFNYIQNLDFVARLPQLQDLFLDDNGLTNVVFPGPLTNLTYLTLDVNRISDLTFLTLLPNLQRLELAANIAERYVLPAGLTNLQFLNLGENHLTNVVLAADLTNLTTLYIDDNRFSELPDLRSQYSLQSLDLSLNQFTQITIPYSLTNLVTLKVVSDPLKQLILPEVLATNSLAALVKDLTNQGVSVLTYPFPPLLRRPTQTPGTFQFDLLGPPGIYDVLHSTDMSSWRPDGVATNLAVSLSYTNSVPAIAGSAYYRVRLE
jgi:Leucine-rich repeat (LRR) protein